MTCATDLRPVPQAPRPAPRVVVAVVRQREYRARVQEALRTRATVRFLETVGRAREVAAEPGVAALLVEPRDATGAPTAPLITWVRHAFPAIPVLAYCDNRAGSSGDIVTLVRAGAHQLIIRDIDDVRSVMAAALDGADRECTAAMAAELLGDSVPRIVRELLVHCVTHVSGELTVPTVAESLGVCRRTLVYRLERVGCPSPQKLIGWGRLLAAARLLEDPGRSLEQVAMSLDLPSGTSLRNMFKRYTGLTPGEIRERGGMARVVALLREELAAAPGTPAAPPLAGTDALPASLTA